MDVDIRCVIVKIQKILNVSSIVEYSLFFSCFPLFTLSVSVRLQLRLN